ncbi:MULTISPECIES: fatty acyl-AMP ligase [Thermomonospora]|uniref:Acyl-CoA synthetase (AMP-forming)/AMP-acid ligase II n=1 Tax=Thermomonospora cellulosilytica TaxID=1411118 RepID=A0A7W3N053_9ACTN|nr:MULTISPECIES: fatty acyl-AMP ligase [Thermomonospora]MBA9005078.1 acyl-CoA synthetase (AMP-forming)/AMP-acid ligase II [Thermomonospora cellulosilytica]
MTVRPLPDIDRTPLITRLGRWAQEYPDERAYTFVDYGTDIDGVPIDLTWGELDRRARAVAAAIRGECEPGRRAAILMPQCMEYVIAFFGAMYARVVGVPLFSPDLPGHAERLLAVYTDADPECVLTTAAVLPQVEAFLDQNPVPRPKRIVVVDRIDEDAGWDPEPISPDDVAYLQYTSGSTRTPAGVIITHGNFAANAVQLWGAFNGTPRTSTGVMWLPLFHDMGLVSVCGLPLVYGNPGTFMDPVAFIMRPVRWLEMLSRYRDVFTGGPNFAYEYLTATVTEEEKAKLDLGGVSVFMNGAEPIRPSTMQDFLAAFSGCGVRPEAQVPAYGLAEATVYVTASRRDRRPTVTAFDREGLEQGVARPCAPDDENASLLVGCGAPWGQHVIVVDPETRVARPDGHVGEIWVHGPNVAGGYWGRPETTAEVFQAALAEPVEGLPEGPWLRTGDLGLWHDGEIYVTGRIKDLIIVDGRNHYPQDLEYTACTAHKAIRRDYAAAFAVTGDDTEGLVIIAERNRRVPVARLDLDEVAAAVRAAVKLRHDVALRDFVLLEPGGLPRTSSAKVARSACRQAYLAGALAVTRPYRDA